MSKKRIIIILFLAVLPILVYIFWSVPKVNCTSLVFYPADFELRESTVDLKKEVLANEKSFLFVTDRNYSDYFNIMPKDMDLKKYNYIFIFDEVKSNSGNEVKINQICTDSQNKSLEVYVSFESSKSRYALDVISRPEIGIKISQSDIESVNFLDSKGGLLSRWENN